MGRVKKYVNVERVMVSAKVEKSKADQLRRVLRTNNIELQTVMAGWIDNFLATTPVNEWGVIVESEGSM